METDFDRRKSLQQLEGKDWGEPNFDSHLVRTCHRLRRVPLTEFTAGDLRIMIGQKISLPFLVPLALERLEENPFIDGDFYRGDLLSAVLQAGDEYWADHPNSLHRVRDVVGLAKRLLPSLDEVRHSMIKEVLAEAPPSLIE